MRELWRERSIIIIEPSIAFLPSVLLLTPKLFAKVFTNERVGIQIPWIVRIFPGQELRSP
jgi:hypothetical protein